METTTNINELPKLSEDTIDLCGPSTQLNESQIHQLVSGIQEASFKGATRLRSTDIPSDPSSVLIDPNTIAKPIETPQPIPPVVHTISSYSKLIEYILTELPALQAAILAAILFIIPHISIVSKYIKGIVPWMYLDDGSLNAIGLVGHAIAVGVSYYILSYILIGH
jgi:hypothetical protein